MEEKVVISPGQSKNPIDALSKEELIHKYKGLLGIAKKAKQAKDEFAEENRKLKEALMESETQKEADKKSILIMKETLEQFTEQKLKLTSELCDLQKKSTADEEVVTKLRIENESLQRQLNRLNEDNESLLKDIDRMEDQLKQVNILGMEQKKHLGLLELEVNKLKEAESINTALQSTVSATQEENKALKEHENSVTLSLEELSRKYRRAKEINAEQRLKFNALKDRFVEIHRKLKNLKECKRVLLETQHEYAEAVSKWQIEIVEASKLIFAQVNILQKENEDFRQQLKSNNVLNYESTTKLSSADYFSVEPFHTKLQELEKLCERVRQDSMAKDKLLSKAQLKEKELKDMIVSLNDKIKDQDNDRQKEEHETEVKWFNQEISDLKTQWQKCEPRLEAGEVNTLHNDLLVRLDTLEAERNSLIEECKRIEELQSDKQRLQIEVDNLNKKLSETTQVHKDLQQTRDVLKQLEEEKISLLEQLQQQESEKHKSEESTKFTEENYIELQKRYSQMEREHADLLCEMRELNEALKARGDVISRQQEKQQELTNELRKTNTKLKQIDEKLLQKDVAIAEKEAQVREITREIDLTRQQTHELEVASSRSDEQLRALNEELQSLRSNADAQSEVLSTSTISRAEELSRLREIDDSFEDKYNKMRGLAVKLKKRLQEQTGQLAEMEQQQSVHVAKKSELEEAHKQLKLLQREHEEQQKNIESLKTENQKLKSSRKQANVLNLEIEAAEKSLMEATTKLATKTGELETLNALLSNKEHTITQLRKEIAIVESAKDAEALHAKELKEQVDLLQEQLKDAVHAKQVSGEARKQLELSQESLKQELEQIKLEISQCSAESSAALLLTQNEKEKLEHRLHQTEVNLKETQIKLQNVEGSLNSLRTEHAEYKQKAQAVLRKQQNTDTTRERELAEELTHARAIEEQQRQTITAQTKKLVELEQQIADLYLDNENLQSRTRALSALEDELRQQNDHLVQEQRLQLQKHQETLRTHRLQLETAHECHAQQMQDMQTKYQQQIDELRAVQSQTVRVPPTVGAATLSNVNASSMHTPTHIESSSNQLLMLAEREDAEGSEEANIAITSSKVQALRKISSSSRRSQHDFMPLDELLNTPMHAFQTDTVTTIGSNSLGWNELNSGNNNAENLQGELHLTRELLAMQESSVRHLTALLAENEQDLAKLTQMNDMLKEELRRQERAVEREQHMHNAEYLKNVVLKFLTLTNNDERVRLVPVLQTILKLSREEKDVLNCVAKGQKLPTETQGRGWGSFLPLFGGGGNN
ncbi:GRIP and coiled-coil domain-containing protein 2 [Bactrocera tryoni]|uniref:GRIP and coiled-coil domain-containing protein 2 n=1 Tax=Bactrocera tryoni TaxID=59916 RepID=UPI001A968343|nr:GRIP and coiled-coil domain-containing protein 2 [Bactrocera tryoni]